MLALEGMSEDAQSCCTPSRHHNSSSIREIKTNNSASTENMVLLEGGSFLMGSNDSTFPADGEGPVREVRINSFWIDKYAVSNADFAAFVEDSNYKTEAETFRWSYVFHLFS